jgi:hypothetical protein
MTYDAALGQLIVTRSEALAEIRTPALHDRAPKSNRQSENVDFEIMSSMLTAEC